MIKIVAGDRDQVDLASAGEFDKKSRMTCMYQPAVKTDRQIGSQNSLSSTDDFFEAFSQSENTLVPKFKDSVCYCFEPVDIGYSVSTLTLSRCDKTFFNSQYFFQAFKSVVHSSIFPPKEFRRTGLIDLSHVSFSAVDAIMKDVRGVQRKNASPPRDSGELFQESDHGARASNELLQQQQQNGVDVNGISPPVKITLDEVLNIDGSSKFWEMHSNPAEMSPQRRPPSQNLVNRFEKHCSLNNKTAASNFTRPPEVLRFYPATATATNVVNYNNVSTQQVFHNGSGYEHLKRMETNYLFQNRFGSMYDVGPLRPLPVIYHPRPYGHIVQINPQVAQNIPRVEPQTNEAFVPQMTGPFHHRLYSEVVALNSHRVNPAPCVMNPHFGNETMHSQFRNQCAPNCSRNQGTFVRQEYNADKATIPTNGSRQKTPDTKKVKKIHSRRSGYRQLNNADDDSGLRTP